MMIIATTLFTLLVLYFIRETAKDQQLSLDYSTYFTPRETVLETRRDMEIPPQIIWKALTDLSNYHLWFPWIKKVQVTNEHVDRWVHRHSLLYYKVEVGSRFTIRPLALSPLMRCRFISLEPEKKLILQMRFFPFNPEIVTFSLLPPHLSGQNFGGTHCVEVHYQAVSKNLTGFISSAMFSGKGKTVLKNLADFLPQVSPARLEEKAKEAGEEEKIVIDDSLINALVAKALRDSADILNSIPEKLIRAKAKSAYTKAKRDGKQPEVTQEATEKIERFLSRQVGIATAQPAPQTPSVPLEKSASSEPSSLKEKIPTQEEKLIQELVSKALEGDPEVLNNIPDKVTRARAKSAYIKAKRQKEVSSAPSD